MWEPIIEGFLELVTKYGLLTGILVGTYAFLCYVIFWLIKKSIESKDKEIERIAETRNQLQQGLLSITKRLTSNLENDQEDEEKQKDDDKLGEKDKEEE